MVCVLIGPGAHCACVFGFLLRLLLTKINYFICGLFGNDYEYLF